MYKSDEEQAAYTMTEYKDSDPSIMKINSKLCPSSEEFQPHEFAYSPAVAELRRVIDMVSPLDKMECVGVY